MNNEKTCELGCGRPARFVLKMGKACCESDARSCPEMRRKNSESHKGKCPKWLNGHPKGMTGKDSWNKGRTYIELMGQEGADDWKKKASLRLKGRLISEAQKKLLSKIAKDKGCGGYRQGGGRGKHGWYKGVWCDSSWELAWVIYHLEHNISFIRNQTKFPYRFEGNHFTYTPDFRMPDESYVEIKGWSDAKTAEKIAQFPHKLVVLKEKEIKPYISYVVGKYGRDFIRLYEDYRVPIARICACGRNLGKTNRSGCCFECGMKKRRHKDRFCPCGKMEPVKSVSGLCKKCVCIGRGRKVERPDVSILLSQIEETGFEATGRFYGVSGNAVRKWLKGNVAELDKAPARRAGEGNTSVSSSLTVSAK